jgi:hypothetical protein
MEELKSDRLIVERQQESVSKITSNQDINRSNISQVATNQIINAEWVEVSSRRCGTINKDKDKLLKRPDY